MRPPRVLLTELREYRSASGSTYFAGYLGRARVVVLRDDRAEITGKEVARWNVLLEEPQPREGREGATTRPAARDGAGGRPQARRQASRPDPAAERQRTAQDRRAGALMRERGVDPGSAPPNDALPF